MFTDTIPDKYLLTTVMACRLSIGHYVWSDIYGLHLVLDSTALNGNVYVHTTSIDPRYPTVSHWQWNAWDMVSVKEETNVA